MGQQLGDVVFSQHQQVLCGLPFEIDYLQGESDHIAKGEIRQCNLARSTIDICLGPLPKVHSHLILILKPLDAFRYSLPFQLALEWCIAAASFELAAAPQNLKCFVVIGMKASAAAQQIAVVLSRLGNIRP